MAKHVVMSVSEISVGGRKLVDVKGRQIVLFNLSGEFFAISTSARIRAGAFRMGVLPICRVQDAR